MVCISARACALLLLTASFAAAAAERAPQPAVRIVVQESPLAGFVYYDAGAVWERMRVGDRLALVRDTANGHDANAVRIEWQGHMLGYVPRKDNADVARQLDHGERIEARVTGLGRHANGRRRIAYEIYVPLQ
jgi:hypothetical protein